MSNTAAINPNSVDSELSTEVAVLAVHMEHLGDRIDDIKTDCKDIRTILEQNEIARTKAHDALSLQVLALDKWRWMMMGAGIVVGSVGWETFSKLLLGH